MSGSIDLTFTAAVQFILAGSNSRRTVFSGFLELPVQTQCDIRSATVPAATINGNGTLSLGNAAQGLAIVCDNAVTVTLTNSSNVTTSYNITTMLVLSCPCTNIILTNTSAGTAVNLQAALIS